MFVVILITVLTLAALGRMEPGTLADAVTLATLCTSRRRGWFANRD